LFLELPTAETSRAITCYWSPRALQLSEKVLKSTHLFFSDTPYP
jgi:hypothetical protein